MKAGQRDAYVISWTQTELDGARAPASGAIVAGLPWRWSGDAVRIAGAILAHDIPADGDETALRRRAARSAARLVGAAFAGMDTTGVPDVAEDDAMPDRGFVLTDGRASYVATEIDSGPGRLPLLMFLDAMPPRGTDLWVVRLLGEQTAGAAPQSGPKGVICFAEGTRIDTPCGPVPVETLRPGDRVLTLDDGAQEILWTGRRRMTGARLYVMPHLRPVRIRAGALGGDRPSGTLLVSPSHRVLVTSHAAETLFNSDEVLVAARDLVNDRSITVDHSLRGLTYVHLMLNRHQVVWANGVATESFHPASTSLDMVPPEQHVALLEAFPALLGDPHAYGGFVRRCLSSAEAAILRHEGRPGH
ncbi:Hint domain-containing protein [Rhodovulum marinum]|uniref:Hint domain-containing protein n=1 Tax=Rhodovulum marinum TaxID=320662 RepID=A0A4R2PSN1_9RHOB|nr:Hint domain-containing protein [Rhodovulum marinum]TCP38869.1 Hint domain-containing protein [Rhodovulum marinum]